MSTKYSIAMLSACSVLALLALAAPPQAAAGTPTDAIRTTTSEVIGLLHNDALGQPGRLAERRHLLDRAIGNRLTYEEISKRTLGEQWDRLTREEKQEFVQIFRGLLVTMYAGRIEDCGVNQVLFLTEHREPGFAEVRARLVSGKSDVTMDFRLVDRAGEWLVYDILTDGISFVNNYRHQFLRILRSASYPTLVEKLREATVRSEKALIHN